MMSGKPARFIDSIVLGKLINIMLSFIVVVLCLFGVSYLIIRNVAKPT